MTAGTAHRPTRVRRRRAPCAPPDSSTSALTYLAAVPLARIWPPKGGASVWVTPAGQLVGSFDRLTSFARRYGEADGSRPYRGWHSHHVVEYGHLCDVGLAARRPAYEDLPCVLLPAVAHAQRLGSVLRGMDGLRLTPAQLHREYAEAYTVLADYTGGGRRAITRELLAITRRLLGLP